MTSSRAGGTAELKGHPWPEAPKRNSYHDRGSSANPSGAPTPCPQEVWPTPALAAWHIRNLLELEAPTVLPFLWTSLCSSPCSTLACLTCPRRHSPVLHLPTPSLPGVALVASVFLCLLHSIFSCRLLLSFPRTPSQLSPSFSLSPPSSSLILSSSPPSMSRAMNSQRELGPKRVGPSGNKDQEAGVPAGATHSRRKRSAPEGIEGVGSPDICAQHVQRGVFAAILEDTEDERGVLFARPGHGTRRQKAQSQRGWQSPVPLSSLDIGGGR